MSCDSIQEYYIFQKMEIHHLHTVIGWKCKCRIPLTTGEDVDKLRGIAHSIMKHWKLQENSLAVSSNI